MRAVLAERKDGLIQFMFQTELTLKDIFAAISQLEDLRLKTEFVVLLLRTYSGFWPVDPDYQGARGTTYDHLIEPFVGVIRDRLPGTSIDESLFVSEASRMELATRLEKALATEQPAPQATPGLPPAGGDSTETTPTRELPAADETSSQPSRLSGVRGWMLPAAGILAVAAVLVGLIRILGKSR